MKVGESSLLSLLLNIWPSETTRPPFELIYFIHPHISNLGKNVDPDIQTPEAVATEKSSDGFRVLGMSLTDPQDLISIFLYSVIAYNAFDLITYYGKKFLGQ
jgi:hypothetical protein